MIGRKRRVLLVSPHFPPDTNAASHRVRLLAPHLAGFGWEPTVLTVDPVDYEGRIDPALAALVPDSVRVVRCRAWNHRWTRRIGLGDLGLRSFAGLYRSSVSLLKREPFDALFITTYPLYPAALGPILKRRFAIPFVIDLQDPWVGAWGETVGAGAHGAPDLKSRLTRLIAERLEAWVLPSADAITAVSPATYDDAIARVGTPTTTVRSPIPIGGDDGDFDAMRRTTTRVELFDPGDGYRHLCYVGTLLPLGVAPMTALLSAFARLRGSRPDLYRQTRLHFIGTSNRTVADEGPVRRIAESVGVEDIVEEHPARIDYLDSLRVLSSATAILLLGSTEPHYTASKLFPALLARRPILAAFHERSTAVDLLRAAGRSPSIRLIAYERDFQPQTLAAAFGAELVPLLESPEYNVKDTSPQRFAEFSAKALAGRLAAVFDAVHTKRCAA
jgi:glycosyltransferase involved in cell wall biosynthesis